ncbi:MAG: ParA family protein [Gammaproteobacteria bacterium]
MRSPSSPERAPNSPHLGAINRAAMIAAEHVVIPLAPDLYSLQGLKNLRPTVRRWRSEWRGRRGRNPDDPETHPDTPGVINRALSTQPCGRRPLASSSATRRSDRGPARYRSPRPIPH